MPKGKPKIYRVRFCLVGRHLLPTQTNLRYYRFMTTNIPDSRPIITVTGPIAAGDMGLTLPHEHIMLDPTKPGDLSPGYDRGEIRKRMLPYLEEIKKHGVRTFVECTPMFIGRDPVLLREISEETGIQIVTNTGQYKPPALPRRTYEISDEELADEWIAEARDGIDGTGIFPGFVKTAVEEVPLLPINRKVIRAAALTSVETGLPIATHTCLVSAATEVLDIIEAEGVAPDKWIFVHAQVETGIHSDIEQVLGGMPNVDVVCRNTDGA